MISETILDLKREFVCEALDLALVHASWAAKHLQAGRDGQAVDAFEKFLSASREAAGEMKAIKGAIEEKQAIGEAAEDFRAQRDGRKPMRAAA